MSLTPLDLARLIVALALLVVAAHALAHLFARIRQPPVIGEILAGLVLGPTVLGILLPEVEQWIFPPSGPTGHFLAAAYQIGLLLLMFLTGSELRLRAAARDARTVAAVSVAGLLLPFTCGVGVAAALDWSDYSGPHGSALTFVLVFGIAVAVTSIPVISRIMLDLGMLHTVFARVVLTVAVVEDIVLYVILAVVLGLGQAAAAEEFGLWPLLGIESPVLSVVYHVAVTLLFFAAALPLGARLARVLITSRANVIERRSALAFRLVLLFGAALTCAVLGINPMFGALLAGLAVARVSDGHAGHDERSRRSWDALRQFSLAFFIPIYFALVGLKLDLIRNFDPIFFLWFFLLACTVKAASVWAGARVSGWSNASSVDLAVALNARGGPGIVLATVTLTAGVINEGFFTTLVLLSVLTSQIAGFWLDRRFGGIPRAGGAAHARDDPGPLPHIDAVRVGRASPHDHV